eukprot:7710927-Alexandrium_andersonii.AAC.1
MQGGGGGGVGRDGGTTWGSARRCRRALTTSRLPPLAARCNGAAPVPVRRLRSADAHAKARAMNSFALKRSLPATAMWMGHQ